MYSHDYEKRVRYGETDQMGYLYYGNYAQYYEIGRGEMIRSLGYTYRAMEEELGVMMPVMSLNQRFIRPAHYDELVTIRTAVRKLPEKTITFHTELYNEAGKLLSGGSAKLAFVDASTRKAVSAPELLINKLLPYFEAKV